MISDWHDQPNARSLKRRNRIHDRNVLVKLRDNTKQVALLLQRGCATLRICQ